MSDLESMKPPPSRRPHAVAQATWAYARSVLLTRYSTHDVYTSTAYEWSRWNGMGTLYTTHVRVSRHTTAKAPPQRWEENQEPSVTKATRRGTERSAGKVGCNGMDTPCHGGS